MKQFYFSIIVALFLFPATNATAQSTAQVATKYVRVSIGHGGLHCPFLGPKMERMYKEISDVSNLKIYKQESYATFEIPAQSAHTDATLGQVAIKAGYPPADVSVVISDSAPDQQQ